MLARRAKHYEELQKASVLMDIVGLKLRPPGWRIKYSVDKRTMIDGPFTGAKELVAGYRPIQVKSMEEEMERNRRCPKPSACDKESEIKVRQPFELGDFGPIETGIGTDKQSRLTSRVRRSSKILGDPS